MRVELIPKKTSTFHDWPYSGPARKCFHAWIVNLTPPGPDHCIHRCAYCYARYAIYSRTQKGVQQVYSNLPELIEKDLGRIALCPPFSISNTTDPCQAVPEVRNETGRIVELLVRRGPSFSITTKGDPSFLLDVEGFVEFTRRSIAITIEGPADVLKELSPGAPPYDKRLEALRKMSSCGVPCIVRLDPAMLHMWKAVLGKEPKELLEGLMRDFREAGARHVVASTGRLSKSDPRPSMFEKLRSMIREHSIAAADEFAADYEYSREYTSEGYLLNREKRLAFHKLARELCEKQGMTYATCQETHAHETDSPGLPHCEGIRLPFTVKGADGRFGEVRGCGANCHVECKERSPPCGNSALVCPEPLKISKLKNKK